MYGLYRVFTETKYIHIKNMLSIEKCFILKTKLKSLIVVDPVDDDVDGTMDMTEAGGLGKTTGNGKDTLILESACGPEASTGEILSSSEEVN